MGYFCPLPKSNAWKSHGTSHKRSAMRVKGGSGGGAPGAYGHTHNHTHKGPPGHTYKTFGEEDDEREPIGRDTMKRESFAFVAKHAPQQPYAPTSTAR